jgi:hemerythrin
MSATNNLVGWNETFALGVDGIDQQHKALFDLINQAWQAVVMREGGEKLGGLIADLEHYTQAHFVAEEAFMQSVGFPEFNAHKQFHRAFELRIAEEKTAIRNGNTLSLDMVRYLQDWLVNHIMVADKAYADFVQAAQSRNTSLLGRFFKQFR